jgi:hypothetical protein
VEIIGPPAELSAGDRDQTSAAASARPAVRRQTHRLAGEVGTPSTAPPLSPWVEPEWQEVAPDLSASCSRPIPPATGSVLLPGVEYPAPTHAGLEELFLLDGELWMDDRKLYPGDYNRAEAPSGDTRVWSETGCTCVPVTSTRDILTP